MIMVVERKGVDRLDIQNQHARTRPPPVLPQRGTRRFLHIRVKLRRLYPDALYETVCQNRLTM
ncbi:hypothetical protein AsoHEU7_01315 [Acinetobacter soli]|nr:hypothetical protein AsoHEU7_01315 [Acinetobacter soli]